MNNFLLFCQEQRQRHDSAALKVNYCLCLNLPSQAELSAAAASPGKDESSQRRAAEVLRQPTQGTLPHILPSPMEPGPLQRQRAGHWQSALDPAPRERQHASPVKWDASPHPVASQLTLNNKPPLECNFQITVVAHLWVIK